MVRVHQLTFCFVIYLALLLGCLFPTLCLYLFFFFLLFNTSGFLAISPHNLETTVMTTETSPPKAPSEERPLGPSIFDKRFKRNTASDENPKSVSPQNPLDSTSTLAQTTQSPKPKNPTLDTIIDPDSLGPSILRKNFDNKSSTLSENKPSINNESNLKTFGSIADHNTSKPDNNIINDKKKQILDDDIPLFSDPLDSLADKDPVVFEPPTSRAPTFDVGSSSSDTTHSTSGILDVSGLTFARSSILSRAIPPQTTTALLSNGRTITLKPKKSKSSTSSKTNNQSSTVTTSGCSPATSNHENIHVSINERNPGMSLNNYDSRNQYGIPIYAFKAKFEEEEREREEQKRNTENTNMLNQSLNESSRNGLESNSTTQKHDTTLLTEKYRPKTWIDLVGPEKTHRKLLRWLRQWSPLVFDDPVATGGYDASKNNNNQFSLNVRDILSRPQKKILLIHGPPGIGKTTVAHVIANQAGYDVLEINASDERSASTVKERIRSAIASHRISQSGNPVCIVADEIEGATESGFVKALVDLIMADSRAVQTIERLIARGGGSNALANKKIDPKTVLKKLRAQRQAPPDDDGTTNLRRKAANRKNSPEVLLNSLLMRPIIAVCNDVYAHSLRALRPYAEIVPYHRVTPYTIVDTLQKVCNKEGYDVDTRDLTQMAIDSECDLRSCLNTLQYGWVKDSTKKNDTNSSRQKIQDPLKSFFLPGASSSSKNSNTRPAQKKDMAKSWSSVVMRVFQQLRGTGTSTINNRSASSSSRNASLSLKTKQDELRKVLEDVLACGEHDRIVSGAFLAYPYMQYHDDIFHKPVEFGDWLYFHDMINRAVYGGNQQTVMGEYYGYTALAAHTLFSNVSNNSGFPSYGVGTSGMGSNGNEKNIGGNSRPSSHITLSEHEFYENFKMGKDLSTSLFKHAISTTPTILQSFSKSEFVTTLIPYLVHFVNPELPSISSGSNMRSFSASTSSSSNRSSPALPNTDGYSAPLSLQDAKALKIRHTMNIMLEFGLQFVLHDTDTQKSSSSNDFGPGSVLGAGGTVYVLDPPIEKLSLFDEQAQSLASTGKYSVRHQINTELFNYRKLMLGSSIGNSSDDKTGSGEGSKKRATDSNDDNPKRRKNSENDDDGFDNDDENENGNGNSNEKTTGASRKKSSNNTANKEKSVGGLFNFAFERIEKKVTDNTTDNDNDKTKKSETSISKSNSDNNEQPSAPKKILAGGNDPHKRAWVQYNEGLSNAVRRNLTWEGIWS